MPPTHSLKEEKSTSPKKQFTFQGKPRTYGMRFSWQDRLIIAMTLLILWLFWEKWSMLISLFLVVLVHFFLFCNVFRIQRKYELIWAGVFVLNYAGWTLNHHFSWLAVLLTQLPITVTLIFLEIRNSRYHGIFARKINPNLEKYLYGEI